MFKALEIFFTLAAVVGGPLLAVMVVPGLARRFLKAAPSPHESNKEELEELRERVAELDHLSRRVTELEERVDFAERLLAQQREAGRLPPG
jgi:hypothetical protein